VRVLGVASLAETTCVDAAFFTRTDVYCERLEELLGGCGDETWAGRCAPGEVAIWCDGETVERVSCAASGRVCGDLSDGTVRCVAPPDPCDGETFDGRCVGTRAIWCDDDRVFEVECTEIGMVCRYDAGLRLNRCGEDPCRGVSWAGQCAGDTAVWCQEDRIRQRRCADCGQSCGWVEAHSGYYCID
jgi:hypothetical protein